MNGNGIEDSLEPGFDPSGTIDLWVNKANPGTLDALQTTAANQGLFVASGAPSGRPVVDFDGLDDSYLMTTGGSPDGTNLIAQQTTFVVLRNTAPLTDTSQNRILGRNTALPQPINSQLYVAPDVGVLEVFDGGFPQSNVIPQIADQELFVASVLYDGVPGAGTIEFFANGQTAGVDTAVGMQNYGYFGSLDGIETFEGEIAELLLFDRVLSASERQAIESYLQQKWLSPTGTPPSLDITFTEPPPCVTAEVANSVLEIATDGTCSANISLVEDSGGSLTVLNRLLEFGIQFITINSPFGPFLLPFPTIVTDRLDEIGTFQTSTFDSIHFESSDVGERFSGFNIAIPMTLNGNGGDDTLTSGSLDDVIDGGLGDDEMYAGAGDDTIRGDAGDDQLYGEGGNDILDGGADKDIYQGGDGWTLALSPNQSHGDTFNAGSRVELRRLGGFFGGLSVPVQVHYDFFTGPFDLIAGIKPEAQTETDLGMKGKLVAWLNETRDTLTFNGPSLHGFEITGDWTIINNPDGSETYRATSTVMLQMASGGAIPLPATSLTPFDVVTKVDPFTGYGELDRIVNLADLLLLDSDVPGSPLATFKQTTGLGFGLPGINFDLALGADLLSAGSVAPLNNSLPYFHFSGLYGNNLVTFGGNSVSSSTGVDFTFAFDPADISVFAQVGVLGGSFFFGFGFSEEGLLRFIPNRTPNVFATAPGLRGHYFVSGKGSFSQIPFSIEGNVLIDLDADDNGVLFDVSGASLNSDNSIDITSVLTSLSDIAVGINGKVNGEVDFGAAGLTIPLASATLIYRDSVIGFSGGSLDPWAGTILDFIDVPSAEIDAFLNFGTGQFAVDASFSNPGIGGFALKGAANLHIDNNSASFNGRISNPVPLLNFDVILSGTIQTNGSFDFRFHAGASFDAGPATLNGHIDFVFAGSPSFVSFTASGSLGGSIEVPILCDPFVRMSANFAFATNGTFSGSAGVRGGCGSFSIGLSASISTSGIWVEIPVFPDLHIDF